MTATTEGHTSATQRAATRNISIPVSYGDHVSLLLGASLVTHLDDAKDEVAVYADGRHTKSACVFCDLLDGQGAVKAVGGLT